MSELLHQLISNSAARFPDAIALKHKNNTLSYSELNQAITQLSCGLSEFNLQRHERIAVYLPKQFEAVISFFSASMVGGVFVPINPVLKAEQVCHILSDCNARILITSTDRLKSLDQEIQKCHDLQSVILVDNKDYQASNKNSIFNISRWDSITDNHSSIPSLDSIDMDMAAILYTSGSTGKPKGVVLSHRNIVTGAKSVSEYLSNTTSDTILSVLPFSFDYGFSQLTTSFYVGATVVLMDYLLPRDVIRIVTKENITGLAAVPPLWIQLSQLEWPDATELSLRYITNSGGAMPVKCIDLFKQKLPNTDIFLMYGLTEAFRSTYLPPNDIHKRPDSMGKAIPNAEILIVREDGTPCAPGETGELVHRGSLVAMGYWNDPDKTSERFKPVPNQSKELPITEIAVWSGDNVKTDDEGYLYFVSRKDEMIKTSGYRVSPTEVEEIVYQSGLINEAVAIGVPHEELGQAIVLIVSYKPDNPSNKENILDACKKQLPNFMIPAEVVELNNLPRNPNGKLDRKTLSNEYSNMFKEVN